MNHPIWGSNDHLEISRDGMNIYSPEQTGTRFAANTYTSMA